MQKFRNKGRPRSIPITMEKPTHQLETDMNEIKNPNDNNSTDVFDRALLTEPEYEVALSELLVGLETSDDTAYDRLARRYPRYAAPLLEAAMIAIPAERRLQNETITVPASVTTAVAEGMNAAHRHLGLEIAPSHSVGEERKARQWSLGEMAQRMHLPNQLALLIDRGQIATWTTKLVRSVAEAFDTTREEALAMLNGTNVQTAGAAAYSAQGTPDTATVTQRRQVTVDFDAELQKVRHLLTAEQADYWDRPDDEQ